VRLSETGPTATAFWRGALALPLLAVWALLERRARAGAAQPEAPAMTRGWRDPMFFWPECSSPAISLVARIAAAHFGRRLDAGSELRAPGRDTGAWALWVSARG